MSTAEKIQHINQVLCDYFAKNNVDEPVPAKQFMDVFIKAGIFSADRREGLPIRELLRELDRTQQLHLIPYTIPVRKDINTNWFFGPVKASCEQDHPDSQISFFLRYRNYKEQTEKQLWTASEKTYADFINRFVHERTEAMKAKKASAPDYNLFSILKLNFAEVILHTPILANLLDPAASHAQGLLFYNLFIQTCLNYTQQERFLKIAPYELKVYNECRNPYGQMDIFLYSCNPHNRFAIIIENKIWAKDQYRQLYRYYQYAREALGLQPEQICLIYLNPTGRDPDTWGLNDVEQTELNAVLTKISYKNHLAAFLQTASCENIPENVKQTILQYHLTIKSVFP